ncbi:MAG: hypothetical protein WDO70_11800 [Alphaproteobacteria bacterium]
MNPDNAPRFISMTSARSMEILWAVVWRGVLYSLIALAVTACGVYIFAQTAWEFFLNDSLRLDREGAVSLFFLLSFPAFILGWSMAVHVVLRERFSDFEIALLAMDRKPSRKFKRK